MILFVYYKIINKLFTMFKKEYIDSFIKQPDLELPSILDINQEIITTYGIKKIILDLDQTFTIQSTTTIPPDFQIHLDTLINILGGSENICFLSNEVDENRAKVIAEMTGVNVLITKFKKPRSEAFKEALNYFNESPGKHVCMIGDRLWTDILGANILGLFTVLVRPLSPIKDRKATSLLRNLENVRSNYGFVSFLTLLATMFQIIGLSIVQLYIYGKELLFNDGKLIDFSPWFIYTNFFFIICVNVCYWLVILHNYSPKYKTLNFKNIIAFGWNTYPLFFRHIVSTLLLVITSWSYFSNQIVTPLLIIANFYCFTSHLSLVTSLFSFYHTNIARVIRIYLDILIVFIVAYNLPPDTSYFALFLLFIPVGTASKYHGWISSIFTITFCSIATFMIFAYNSITLFNPFQISLIYCFLFIFLTIVLKLESKEASNPIDHLIKKLHQEGIKNIKITKLLMIFSKVMNCEGIYYIHSRKSGYYYLNDHLVEKGEISKHSNNEIFNYLKANFENVVVGYKSSPLEIINKQRKLLNDFNTEVNLQPLPIRPLKSIIVHQLPNNQNQFLIFTNGFTFNGITRRKFSISHLRTSNLCSLLISKVKINYSQN